MAVTRQEIWRRKAWYGALYVFHLIIILISSFINHHFISYIITMYSFARDNVQMSILIQQAVSCGADVLSHQVQALQVARRGIADTNRVFLSLSI